MPASIYRRTIHPTSTPSKVVHYLYLNLSKTLPRDLPPIVLIQAPMIFPPRHTDIKKLPILRGIRFTHDIQHSLGALLCGEIGAGSPYIRSEPLSTLAGRITVGMRSA